MGIHIPTQFCYVNSMWWLFFLTTHPWSPGSTLFSIESKTWPVCGWSRTTRPPRDGETGPGWDWKDLTPLRRSRKNKGRSGGILNPVYLRPDSFLNFMTQTISRDDLYS